MSVNQLCIFVYIFYELEEGLFSEGYRFKNRINYSSVLSRFFALRWDYCSQVKRGWGFWGTMSV